MIEIYSFICDKFSKYFKDNISTPCWVINLMLDR